MGPGFGHGLGKDLTTLFVVLFISGGIIGVGCYEGCRYVIEHVDVGWSP
jgi:hypothetical protein